MFVLWSHSMWEWFTWSSRICCAKVKSDYGLCLRVHWSKRFNRQQKKTFIHKMRSHNKNGRRATTTREHMIVQVGQKQRGERPTTAAAATVENRLWDSHHTTIVKMARSHFARWTDELRKKTPNKMRRARRDAVKFANERQTNAKIIEAGFLFCQRQLLHITREITMTAPRQCLPVWLTQRCYCTAACVHIWGFWLLCLYLYSCPIFRIIVWPNPIKWMRILRLCSRSVALIYKQHSLDSLP